ncbi:hypothetical protein B0A50_05700 [Salinomyces thailandicus]|uniref:RING-type domain-containing protein n=1 Tax=Salinomyces thailandicus TaxID=706561 RepID=A0A4U0TS49_9PEZI|nr:hypothetical protein B0A50_05700 [Salinomyces thailandica]
MATVSETVYINIQPLGGSSQADQPISSDRKVLPALMLLTREGFLGELDPIRPDEIPLDRNGQRLDCTICRQQFSYTDRDACYPVRTTCGHIFGSECIKEWFESTGSNRCCFCQHPLFRQSSSTAAAIPIETSDVDGDVTMLTAEEEEEEEEEEQLPTVEEISRNDKHNLPELRYYARHYHSELGARWWTSSESAPLHTFLDARLQSYNASHLDTDRQDYVPYNRIIGTHAVGLPPGPRKVDAANLTTRLSERFWKAFDAGLQHPSSTSPVSGVPLYPLEAHPFTHHLTQLLHTTLESLRGQNLTADKLELKLHSAIKYEPGMDDLKLRSITYEGDLPPGMYAYVLDTLELVLGDFVAGGVRKGVAEVKRGRGLQGRGRKMLY